MTEQPGIWMVRAGRGSRYIDEFRAENIVAVGWVEMPEFDPAISREEIKDLYRATYPNDSEGKVVAGAGQIYRFLHGLEVGDDVATYDADQRVYLLGRVAGTPEFGTDHPDLNWKRAVEWTHHVARDSLSAGTRNSLGAISTIFRPGDTVRDELFEKAVDLESEPRVTAPPESAVATGDDDDLSVESVATRANDLIEDLIVLLKWDELQELVAGVLRAMGYQTDVAAKGPDRGVDIFASPDGLGLEEPRIFVEVKHRPGSTMGGSEVRSFLGGRQPGDRCLYVSTGGFTKDAHYEAARANVPIKLVTLPRLRQLIVQHYDEMEPEIQAMVPLRRIYWPAD